MQITLYKNLSENNALNKNLIVKDTVEATIKGNISLENPILLLVYDSTIKNDMNYLYIEEYNRYYFITDLIDLTGGRYEIHCYVDVLESFKDEILNLECIICKQENETVCNKFYNDGSFAVTSQEFLQSYNFPNGFNNNGEFILICAGGESNE